MAQNNEIRKEVSKSQITVDHVKSGTYTKAGMEQAQLRQTVTTTSYYPSAKAGNSLSDNLFSQSEFTSVVDKTYTSHETRIAWINVPEGTTPEDIVARLAAAPEACIYKILSNKPILTNEQVQAISAGLKDMDDFAKTQVIRYSEGTKDAQGNDIGGQIVLDTNQKVQYKATFFSNSVKEDVDERTADNEMYAPEFLMEEIEGAVALAGQTI